MIPTPPSLRDLILGFLAGRTPGLAGTAIADTVNLVESQIIDSVGLVDLLLFLEAETGRPIDFMAIDPERMTSIAGIRALFGEGALPPDPHQGFALDPPKAGGPWNP